MNKDIKYFWDTSSWNFDDKAWLAERKKEWRMVQHALKRYASTEIRGAYLKQHKKLFFEGVIEQELLNESGGRPFGFSLSFFILWYHPNLTASETDRVIEYACKTASNACSAANSRAKIAKICSKNDLLIPEYGFLGERTEKLIACLWGEPLIGAKFDQVSFVDSPSFKTEKNYLNLKLVSSFFWAGVMSQLVYGRYDPGQFLFSHAMAVSDKIDEYGEINIRQSATHILYYDESTAVHKDNVATQNLKDLMMKRYEQNEFHPVVKDIWDDVKAGNTMFEFN